MPLGFPGGPVVKNPPANPGDLGFDSWVRKIPWSRKWQPTPVFFPGEFHGQRSLVGDSLWGHKELDPTEQLNNNNSKDAFPAFLARISSSVMSDFL